MTPATLLSLHKVRGNAKNLEKLFTYLFLDCDPRYINKKSNLNSFIISETISSNFPQKNFF